MSRYVLDAAPEQAPQARYVLDDSNYSPAYGLFQTVIGQGLGFGFGDEIAAGVRSLVGSETYDEALKSERQNLRTFRDRNKILSTVGEVAGGMAVPGVGLVRGALRPAASAAGRIGQAVAIGGGTGAVTGFGQGEDGFGNRAQQAAVSGTLGAVLGGGIGMAGEGLRQINRARANMGEAGAYGRIGDDLPGGADALADQIAAGPSRANVATNRRTLDILGDEMVRARGDVQAAEQATIARIMTETGAARTTAVNQVRQLRNVHADSDLMLAEYPAVAGSDAALRGPNAGLRQARNVDLDELGRVQDSTTQAKLDYLANNGAAQSAQDVRNAISTRQERLAPSMRETLEGIGPQAQPPGGGASRPANIADAEAIIDNARQLGSQEYRQAYNSPVNNSLMLNWLPRMLQWHENRAASRSGDIERAIRNATDQFYINTPNGRLAMGTLQQLQDARGVVRGQIQSYRQQGRDDLVNAVQPVYEHITRLMTNMSPQWARANQRWADMNFLRMGAELGDAFATKAGPRFREQIREFDRLAPEAQNIVRIHFLQKLYDKLDDLGDTHAVSKLFANDHNRNMIRALFGPEAAITFTRAVRDQRVAEASQRMMANSATHRRGVAQQQMQTETGLMAAVGNANAGGVRNWLLQRATQLVTERRDRPMAAILTTPMSDTAQIAQHLARMRGQAGVLTRAEEPVRATLPAAGAAGSATAALARYLMQSDRREGR
jgi:hypothetical protein